MWCFLFGLGCCGAGVEGKSSARCLLFVSKPCGTGVEGHTTLGQPGSAAADRLKKTDVHFWVRCCGYKRRKFFSRIENSMSLFEGYRLRLYSRKIFWKPVSFLG